jgi:hypothetical protein
VVLSLPVGSWRSSRLWDTEVDGLNRENATNPDRRKNRLHAFKQARTVPRSGSHREACTTNTTPAIHSSDSSDSWSSHFRWARGAVRGYGTRKSADHESRECHEFRQTNESTSRLRTRSDSPPLRLPPRGVYHEHNSRHPSIRLIRVIRGPLTSGGLVAQFAAMGHGSRWTTNRANDTNPDRRTNQLHVFEHAPTVPNSGFRREACTTNTTPAFHPFV